MIDKKKQIKRTKEKSLKTRTLKKDKCERKHNKATQLQEKRRRNR